MLWWGWRVQGMTTKHVPAEGSVLALALLIEYFCLWRAAVGEHGAGMIRILAEHYAEVNRS